MILIDPIVMHPRKPGLRWTSWCHMVATIDEDELHAFAARLGMKRAWAQLRPEASAAHYDLVPSRRALAVSLGAREVTSRTLALANYDGLRRRGKLEILPDQRTELLLLGIEPP